jgi:hypothetical protein
LLIESASLFTIIAKHAIELTGRIARRNLENAQGQFIVQHEMPASAAVQGPSK